MAAHTHDDQERCVILVVDDDPIILWGTASLLEALHFEIVRANSGKAALEALRNRRDISVLVTDFEMPQMSGVELAREAQTARPNLAVVIATGHTSFNTNLSEPWVTLAKPFTSDGLQNAITLAMGNISTELERSEG